MYGGYNGYTNRDTWAVVLNLSNEEHTYHEAVRVATSFKKLGAALMMRSLWNELRLPDYDSVDTVEVDWVEVVEAFREDEE